MSNLSEYAKKEMDLAWPESDEMQDLVKKDVLELIEKFSDQNHSGMSAPYVLRIFNRLVNWLPILPLTGEEDEWNDPNGDEHLQQNKRCGHIFRTNFDNNTAFNSEGKVFVDKDGISYTNRNSIVPITFPYEVPDQPVRVYVEDAT